MPARTSRLPALRRFRKARMERAIEAIERRAAALAVIAGAVTDLVAETRTQHSALRRNRLVREQSAKDARRARKAAFRAKVKAALAAYGSTRSVERLQAQTRRRGERASLRAQSLRILQTDFSAPQRS